MNWIIAHYADIGLWLFIAQTIASATPPNLVVLGIPIGKVDNQIVDAIKAIFKAIFLRGKS